MKSLTEGFGDGFQHGFGQGGRVAYDLAAGLVGDHVDEAFGVFCRLLFSRGGQELPWVEEGRIATCFTFALAPS